MRAFVIGGSGFIGAHLVDSLLSQGTHVRAYDRAGERGCPTRAEVDFWQGDFDDAATLAEALVDVVFHLPSTLVPSTRLFSSLQRRMQSHKEIA